VTGTLTLTGSSIDLTAGGGTGFDSTQSYSWLVATATGGGTGSPTIGVVSGAGFAGVGSGFTTSARGTNLYLNFTPVPEPATVLGLAAAGLAVGARFRRRRTA